MEPGTEETFEQFYRQHEHRVRRLLMGMLGAKGLWPPTRRRRRGCGF